MVESQSIGRGSLIMLMKGPYRLWGQLVGMFRGRFWLIGSHLPFRGPFSSGRAILSAQSTRPRWRGHKKHEQANCRGKGGVGHLLGWIKSRHPGVLCVFGVPRALCATSPGLALFTCSSKHHRAAHHNPILTGRRESALCTQPGQSPQPAHFTQSTAPHAVHITRRHPVHKKAQLSGFGRWVIFCRSISVTLCLPLSLPHKQAPGYLHP